MLNGLIADSSFGFVTDDGKEKKWALASKDLGRSASTPAGAISYGRYLEEVLLPFVEDRSKNEHIRKSRKVVKSKFTENGARFPPHALRSSSRTVPQASLASNSARHSRS
jgi:hypothetical protein